MEDNKRDFESMNDPMGNNDRSQEQEERSSEWEKKDSNSSYYYSYGPYRSQEPQNLASGESTGESVEVSPPRQVKPIGWSATGGRGPSSGGGKPPKQKSRVMSTLAMIMATVLVTGGLMFGADHYNIFTGAPAKSVPASVSTSGENTSVTAAKNNTSLALDVVRPNNIASIVKNTSPAVVKIETFVNPSSQQQRGNSLYDDPFFRQFFGDSATPSQPKNNEPQASGMGSGFIFEKTGYILTNEHVVEGSDVIHVYVEGKDEPYTAELLGHSAELDLAVLKIKGEGDFPTLPLASEIDSLSVGDWVVAIGNPYGMDHTVTVGVLSAKGRSIDIQDGTTVRNYKNLLQTDASINPGNSGGPLLNLNGEVIGINTAINSQAQGIGYVVPITTINEVVDKLKNNVEIPKEPVPYIGVQMSNVPQEYVAELGLKNTDGAFIQSVVMGSPAFKAGVKAYDVILSVNDTPIKNSEALSTNVKKLAVGDKATLTIMRDSKQIKLEVIIGDSTKVEKTQ